MKLIRRQSELATIPKGGALTMGNFDGVHRGHARIMERLRQWAVNVDGPATVLTFEPHPVRLLRPEMAPAPLTWTERKAELVGELGIDTMVVWPVDRDFLKLSPEAFFDQIVLQTLGARAVVEGPNFYFGRNREGNVDMLQRLCRDHDIGFEIVDPVREANAYLSSTRVRKAIAEGRIEEANQMLTCPYRIRGMVVHGDGRGTGIGFPTANLDAIDTLIPAPGVYCGRARVNMNEFTAAIHVGPSPTFGNDKSHVEVHLLDFADSIYGDVVEVDFVARLRGTQNFVDASELVAQLEKDVAAARARVQ